MKYRNEKRKAAIWILSTIIKPRTARVTGLRNFKNIGSYEEVNEKYYDEYRLKDLIAKQQPYSRELLRDAVDFLYINGDIQLSENEKDRFDIGIKANKEGEISLRDDKYDDEIDIYNSDTIYRSARMWLPVSAIIVSLMTLGYSVYQNNTKTVALEKIQADMQCYQKKVDTMELKIKALKIDGQQAKIGDPTHPNNGQ